MHISEAVLSGPDLITGAASAAADTAIGSKELDYGQIAKASMLSATFFLVSLTVLVVQIFLGVIKTYNVLLRQFVYEHIERFAIYFGLLILRPLGLNLLEKIRKGKKFLRTMGLNIENQKGSFLCNHISFTAFGNLIQIACPKVLMSNRK